MLLPRVSNLPRPFIIINRHLGTSECFSNIERRDAGDGGVNAFVALNSRNDDKSRSGPLQGIPIAVKDNICTSDLPTSCASDMLEGFRPSYDATVVQLLRSAGARIVGKTNCDEFGMGSLNVYSSHGPVINPFSPSSGGDWRGRERRSAGGSSGGSAAAVADGMCFAALGTDTGGSVRLPASYCGVVGLKPSYGLISRWGVVSFADSLDCVGILAPSSRGIEEIFEVIAQPDAKDPTAIAQDLRDEAKSMANARIKQIYRGADCESPFYGLRVGVPKEYFPRELDESIKARFHHTLSILEDLGASITSVSLPSTKYALSAYYVIASAEASSNLARYDGVQYGSRRGFPSGKMPISAADFYAETRSIAFGGEVIRRILLGSYALTADAFDNYFLQAQRVRNLVRSDYDHIFRDHNVLASSHSPKRKLSALHNGVDVIVHPAAIRTAPLLQSTSRLSTSRSSSHTGTPLEAYVQDVLTVPASLAGIPSLTVPMPSLADGEWPVGLSVTGQWGSEALLICVGKVLEKVFRRDSL